MLTAELHILQPPEAGGAAKLDQLIAGRGEVQITVVRIACIGYGQIDLEPLLVEALTPVASTDPTIEASGALVRVFIQHPEDT